MYEVHKNQHFDTARKQTQTEGPASIELSISAHMFVLRSRVSQTLLYNCIYKSNIQMRADVKNGY